MKPDFDAYMPLLAELDLTDDQKREYIQLIWDILENIADRAFGFDSVQLTMQAKFRENAADSTSPSSKLGLGFKTHSQPKKRKKGPQYELR